MEKRPTNLIEATTNAFDGMKRILFQPFDLARWFVIGFTAWLAQLLSGSSSMPSFSSDYSGSSASAEEVPELPASPQEVVESGLESLQPAIDWYEQNKMMVISLGVVGALIVMIIAGLLIWLSSRGKFMLLDNVVHNRAEIAIPWRSQAAAGWSLFWWNAAFSIVSLVAGLAFVAGVFYLTLWPHLSGAENWQFPIFPLISLVLVFLLFALIYSYIMNMLESFVIPIMYKRGIGVMAAWGVFLKLHRQYFWTFILYFLWLMVLGIALGLAVMLFGVVTCCLGFIVMAIPYVGAVLLLPISVWMRLLGPELLRQIGPEYDLWESYQQPTDDQPPAS